MLSESPFSLFSLLLITFVPPSRSATGIRYIPIQPPSYPLAVRNPYLSTWMPGTLVRDLPSATPQFWAGQNLTWSIIARVDQKTYNLFGVPDPGAGTGSAEVQCAEYTSTYSAFTLNAGSAKIKLNFFSPVSPSNYLRQSLPFSMSSFIIPISQNRKLSACSHLSLL